MKEDSEMDEEIKKTVIARIDAGISQNIKISIGSGGCLSKEEMIEHVEKNDEIGKQIIKMHLNFIKALTSGALINELNKL